MADALAELTRRAGHLIASSTEHLDFFASREYPTKSPAAYIEFLRSILRGIESRLADSMDEATARSLCEFLLSFGEDIRFLETATHPSAPWALIGPMEDMISAIVPGTRLVLRSDWEYNYQILRISELYRRSLVALQPYLTDSLFASPPPIWNIVTLPIVDRQNILMHVVLGHEAGHRIAEEFLELDNTVALGEVNAAVEDGKWFDPKIDAYGPLFEMKAKRDLFKRLHDMRTRALKELISDIVGFRIFGPSFLLAVREFSLNDVLDTVPHNPYYYPPWRYRFRLLANEYRLAKYPELLARLNGSPVVATVRDAALAHIQFIIDLTRDTPDLTAINGEPVVARAYKIVDTALPRATAFLNTRLDALSYRTVDLPNRLPQLVGRLAIGVPPAELDAGTLVNFRDALLAGALYHTARLSIPFASRPWSLDDDIVLFRLVHKAIEYTHIGAAFGKWLAANPDP